MAARSNRVANGLRQRGVRRGDRILLMLGNVAPLWETMLAAMKLGAVVIPSTLLLTAEDLAERAARARIRTLIVPAAETEKFANADPEIRRICIGDPPSGWLSFDTPRDAPAAFTPDGETQADDPMLLYFTSGTTSKPKMVLHSHRSYPVGHLATMYWVGAKPGDIHLSIGAGTPSFAAVPREPRQDVSKGASAPGPGCGRQSVQVHSRRAAGPCLRPARKWRARSVGQVDRRHSSTMHKAIGSGETGQVHCRQIP